MEYKKKNHYFINCWCERQIFQKTKHVLSGRINKFIHLLNTKLLIHVVDHLPVCSYVKEKPNKQTKKYFLRLHYSAQNWINDMKPQYNDNLFWTSSLHISLKVWFEGELKKNSK